MPPITEEPPAPPARRPVGPRKKVAVIDPYLPIEELATYSGLSTRVLRRYLHDPVHPLPFYQVGNKNLVRQSEYDAWVQQFRKEDAPADVAVAIDRMVRGERR